ncbi:non-homologous end-joining DNA ligase [Pseudokineococcus sp. 1T1Z-3]|uniref:non-homologous end-joining DNA ligase n=1 Tax=Pseudokineococcus sp. 1T1Z-3 TaxID=3132745 RepID=UPI00309F1C37
MLATPTADPGSLPATRGAAPDAPDPVWSYEVKWDGMRLLADVGAGGLRLSSRTERDVGGAFPDLAGLPAAAAAVGGDLLLDGEVVALDPAGRPSFGVLAPRLGLSGGAARRAARAVPLVYVVFDVLRAGGQDLVPEPLRVRREVLEGLGAQWLADPPVVGGAALQVSPGFGSGADVLAATRAQGLEGGVAKRWDSPYRPGVRSRTWVKATHRTRRTVVVGGWRPQEGTTTRVGALLVGAPDADGCLRYLGRVGSGVGPRAAAQLAPVLAPLHRSTSPFGTDVPREDARGATWVEPHLRAEVESLGSTSGGRLRQPSFLGLRADAEPEVVDPADLPGAP